MRVKTIHRRWLQFSLRTFLLVVTCLAILLGSLANRFQAARRERHAIQELSLLGAHCFYKSAGDERGHVSRLAPSFAPDWLQKMLGPELFGRVAGVSFEMHQPSAREWKSIEDFTELESLNASWVHVSETGFKSIGKITSLQNLAIAGSSIDAAGLKELCKLNRLTELNLLGTDVPEAELAELRRALPNCRIQHNNLSYPPCGSPVIMPRFPPGTTGAPSSQ